MEFGCICKGKRSQLVAYFLLSKACRAVKLIALCCVQTKTLESSSVFLCEYVHGVTGCCSKVKKSVKGKEKKTKKRGKKEYISTTSWGTLSHF